MVLDVSWWLFVCSFDASKFHENLCGGNPFCRGEETDPVGGEIFNGVRCIVAKTKGE